MIPQDHSSYMDWSQLENRLHQFLNKVVQPVPGGVMPHLWQLAPVFRRKAAEFDTKDLENLRFVKKIAKLNSQPVVYAEVIQEINNIIQQRLGFGILNRDVIGKIASFLDPKSLMQLKAVNKYFYNLIGLEEILLSTSSCLYKFSKYCDHVKISEMNLPPSKVPAVWEKFIQQFYRTASMNQQIALFSKLSMRGCQFVLTNRPPAIKEFFLAVPSNKLSEEKVISQLFSEQQQTIESLVVHASFGKEWDLKDESKIKLVEKIFCIDGISSLTLNWKNVRNQKEQFGFVKGRSTNTIWASSFSSSIHLQPLANQLKTLKLIDFCFPETREMNQVGTLFKAVENLELDECLMPDVENAISFLQFKFPNLKKLKFKELSNASRNHQVINDLNILHLIKTFPQLNQIYFTHHFTNYLGDMEKSEWQNHPTRIVNFYYYSPNLRSIIQRPLIQNLRAERCDLIVSISPRTPDLSTTQGVKRKAEEIAE